MQNEQSTTHQIRNRIKDHRKVPAGDLVPHEWNFRLHPDGQKAALAALYQEVGFARSLLAYEMPDGRLKLIDGHLRRDLDPNLEVDVEVLDVNDDEARALLLSIDPLAALAQSQDQIRQRLLEMTPTTSADLQAACQRVPALAVFYLRRPGVTHTGILHRAAGQLFILDLVWHEMLRSEQCRYDLPCVLPNLEPEEINDVTGICRLIHQRHVDRSQAGVPLMTRNAAD